jgi:hypothetical protein
MCMAFLFVYYFGFEDDSQKRPRKVKQNVIKPATIIFLIGLVTVVIGIAIVVSRSLYYH